MREYRNNVNRIIHDSKLCALRSKLAAIHTKFLALSATLLALCFIFVWILFPDKAKSGPYLDSAHGNTSYGVLRTSLNTSPNNYSRGNCAHCHEQHASIGGAEPAPNSPAGPDFYLLFKDLWVVPIQSNVFCFGCHIEIGSYQSIFQRTNYSYSYWKGGDTTLTCPDSIYESFQFVLNNGTSQSNCGSTVGSSHILQDIRAFLRNKWGFLGTASQVDPCSGCHNPHKVKRDFPCSRPSAHTDIYAWNVWGDDVSERMNSYTPTYWAPKRVGGGYEPDGTFTQNGSNMPDYVSLCTDCHNRTSVIYSTRLGRDLYRINWGAGGDFHGTRPRNDGPGDRSGDDEWGDLLAPYKVGSTYQYTNYALSCTDCHEPHGSPNEFLLRKTVNGTPVNIINGNGRWYYWCQTCHYIDVTYPAPIHAPIDENFDCFIDGGCHRHCDATPCPTEGTLM